jgi:hypothetical protein
MTDMLNRNESFVKFHDRGKGKEKMFLGFVVPCMFNHSNKTPNQMQQSSAKFYFFVVQTLLNMFRALPCPSSGARQSAVAASGFRMNVEVEAEKTSTSTLIRKPEAATAV